MMIGHKMLKKAIFKLSKRLYTILGSTPLNEYKIAQRALFSLMSTIGKCVAQRLLQIYSFILENNYEAFGSPTCLAHGSHSVCF